MLYLGVHVSISGGIIRAKEETAAIGGNCMQIFTGSPQSLELGKVYELSKLEKAKIKAALQNFPTYIHSKYLLNFGRARRNTRLQNIAVNIFTFICIAASTSWLFWFLLFGVNIIIILNISVFIT